MKKNLIWALKILLAILFFIALFRYDYLDWASLRISFSAPDRFIPALFLLFFGIVAGGVRWWLLLKLSGLNLGLAATMHIQLVGSFFSTYLPGAAGGDLVRGLNVCKHLGPGQGRSIALISIGADRIFALFGLLMTASLVSLYLLIHPENSLDAGIYIDRVVQILSVGSGLLIFAVLLALLLRKMGISNYLPARIAAYMHVARLTFNTYCRRWLMLVVCSIISVIASVSVAVGIVLIASIFPFAPPPTVSAIAGVFGNVFSAIPITPGGLGVGEVVFARICADLTKVAAPYATIYLTFRVGMLLANIPGGILVLLGKGRVSSQVPNTSCYQKNSQ